MTIRFQSEEIALRYYVQPTLKLGGTSLVSSFSLCLADARGATGRNHDGMKLPEKDHHSWLGAICYMVLLDQIGTCVRPKTAPHSTVKSGFRMALKLFSALSDAEADALYALRCSFAHDFGLVNVSHNPNLTHCFAIAILDGRTIVRLPDAPWDGKSNEAKPGNVTYVDLVAFGDFAEEICHRMISMAIKKELAVALPGGHEEMALRYFIGAEDEATTTRMPLPRPQPL
jgi:hypothetical protein